MKCSKCGKLSRGGFFLKCQTEKRGKVSSFAMKEKAKYDAKKQNTDHTRLAPHSRRLQRKETEVEARTQSEEVEREG